jgi:hypothetical protein
MKKEDAPKKRNGYYYRDNKQYVSVTKVLGDVLNKPALIYWTGREATRIALKNPWLNEKEVMAELQLQQRATQGRGKYVHSIAETAPESFVVNFDEPKLEYEGYIKALKSWWETFKPEVIGREVEAFSDSLGCACRVDNFSRFNGFKWLLDFKTGKDIYREVGLQLAFGKQALKEDKIFEADKTGVVLLMETGEFKFQETNDTIFEFINVLNVWNWMQKKGGD